jgi:hypothetical protein
LLSFLSRRISCPHERHGYTFCMAAIC